MALEKSHNQDDGLSNTSTIAPIGSIPQDPSLSSSSSSPSSASSNFRFPISELPYEIRQFIYREYLQQLPECRITCSNALHGLHHETALALASPFFASELSPRLFHDVSAFSFSRGEDLKMFSSAAARAETVRTVRICYGPPEPQDRDWVFLAQSCFWALEELTFVLEGEWAGLFASWWEMLVDAVGEGMSNPGRLERLRGKRGSLTLSVENGEGGRCVSKVLR
jgi:hypothetical protein